MGVICFRRSRTRKVCIADGNCWGNRSARRSDQKFVPLVFTPVIISWLMISQGLFSLHVADPLARPAHNSRIEQWRPMIIVRGYTPFVTSQYNVIFTFVYQRHWRSFLTQQSYYSTSTLLIRCCAMCHCNEHRLQRSKCGEVNMPHNVEFVTVVEEWTQSSGEYLLLLCQGSSDRLPVWLAQGDAAMWLQHKLGDQSKT